jgi:hypothetical protein
MLLFCFFSRAFSAFVDMFYNCSEMDTRTMCIAQTQNSLTIIYNNRILKKWGREHSNCAIYIHLIRIDYGLLGFTKKKKHIRIDETRTYKSITSPHWKKKKEICWFTCLFVFLLWSFVCLYFSQYSVVDDWITTVQSHREQFLCVIDSRCGSVLRPFLRRIATGRTKRP